MTPEFLQVARDYLASVIQNPDSHKKDATFRVGSLTADKNGWAVDNGPSRKRYAAPLANLQAAIAYLEKQ